ncbi:MAG: hypothetical protein KAT56_07600 [Sedimentisphaerales bacterium]|nr:hypothetical protein [Sedimentisphaerales bacterium]
MLSVADIKHRAISMGICTGQMPDVEFIWSVQRAEGNKPCFGQGKGCRNRECIWRRKCLSLSYFAEVALPLREGLAEHTTTKKKNRDKEVIEQSILEGMREQRRQKVPKQMRKEGKREKVFSGCASTVLGRCM